MSIFRGQPTASVTRPAKAPAIGGVIAERFILTRETFPWVMPSPTDGRPCYALHLYGPPHADAPYRVVASMGVNESMRRLFDNEADARRVFDGVGDWTTREGLWKRGFRTW